MFCLAPRGRANGARWGQAFPNPGSQSSLSKPLAWCVVLACWHDRRATRRIIPYRFAPLDLQTDAGGGTAHGGGGALVSRNGACLPSDWTSNSNDSPFQLLRVPAGPTHGAKSTAKAGRFLSDLRGSERGPKKRSSISSSTHLATIRVGIGGAIPYRPNIEK